MKLRLLALAALMSTGITLATPAEPPETHLSDTQLITLAPGEDMHLPPLAALNRTVAAVQNIVATYDDKKVSFQARIDARPDQFLLVCTDGMGRRAITIRWDESGVSYKKASWVPDTLRPQNMLADVVMIYWPDAALKQALPEAEIVTTQNHRSITRDGEALADIRYTPHSSDIWQGKTHYHNARWDYSLSIESALSEP